MSARPQAVVIDDNAHADDPTYAIEVKLIHIGRGVLGLAEDQYRALLEGVTGKSSAKQMNQAERQAVLGRMKAMGFAPKPRANARPAVHTIREAQHRKLRAMWYALAAVNAVGHPPTAEACNAAIEAWALRQVKGLESMATITGYQMAELIEGMKAWGQRVGAQVHG